MKHKPDGKPKTQRPSSPKNEEGEIPPAGHPGPDAFSDWQWKIAQLAATLATRYAVPHGRSHIAKRTDPTWTLVANEADPQLDPFYLSLLRRAEFLLIYAGARWGQLHAANLFEPGTLYTVKEITAEFQQAGWAGLESENSVRTLLAKVKEVYTKQTDELIEHFVRSEIDDEYYKPSGKKHKGKADATKAEIAAILEDPTKAASHPNISAQIKGQIALRLFIQGGLLDALGKGRHDSKIEPHQIFAVCLEDKLFDEKLWRKRSELSRTFLH